MTLISKIIEALERSKYQRYWDEYFERYAYGIDAEKLIAELRRIEEEEDDETRRMEKARKEEFKRWMNSLYEPKVIGNLWENPELLEGGRPKRPGV